MCWCLVKYPVSCGQAHGLAGLRIGVGAFLDITSCLQEAHVLLFKYGEDGEDESAAYRQHNVQACTGWTVLSSRGSCRLPLSFPSPGDVVW